MNISDFLAPADVLIDFGAADKKQLLQELSRHFAHAKKLDANGITQAIFMREELGSTGVWGGVAMPHARIANLKDARKKGGTGLGLAISKQIIEIAWSPDLCRVSAWPRLDIHLHASGDC